MNRLLGLHTTDLGLISGITDKPSTSAMSDLWAKSVLSPDNTKSAPKIKQNKQQEKLTKICKRLSACIIATQNLSSSSAAAKLLFFYKCLYL